MTDVFLIAGRLADPPFNVQLTTSQLMNEMDSREMSQLLNRVLGHIIGRTEGPFQSNEHLLSWLRIFKYKSNTEQ